MSNWRDNFIAAHGIEAYEAYLVRRHTYHKAHKEEEKAYARVYRELHLEEIIANSQEQCRKGGRHYDKTLKYQTTGLRYERNLIRTKHRRQYKPYKDIIAPGSQLHHEWRPQSPLYDGLALVERDQHMHGFIDVIEILKGEITVFTEEELRDIGEEL